MNLEALRDQLLADMFLIGRTLNEQGFIVDPSFPSAVKEWIMKNCMNESPLYDCDFKVDDVYILTGQLMLIRHALLRQN